MKFLKAFLMNPGTHELVRGVSTFVYVAHMQSLIDALLEVDRRAGTDKTRP